MDHSEAALLLEQAFIDFSQTERRHTPTRSVDWDANLVEVTNSLRSRIPPHVLECWGRARQRANCGFFAEVQHAWVSVDSTLFLWDYKEENPSLVSLPADSAIISVTLGVPRPGVFDPQGSGPNSDQAAEWLLVLATRLTVSLIGLTRSQGLPSIQTSFIDEKTEVQAANSCVTFKDWSSISSRQPHRVPGSTRTLRLVPLRGFVAHCDGALFHCVRSTPEGRIFLISGSPQLHELVCYPTAGWLHGRCQLVKHNLGSRSLWCGLRNGAESALGRRHATVLPGRLRLLEICAQGLLVTCDDVGTLRLFLTSDFEDQFGVQDNAEDVDTIHEVAVLTVDGLAQQVLALTRSQLASYTISHLYCTTGFDGHLHLDVATVAADRLQFVCSVSPSSSSSNATGTSPRFGFFLQHVIVSSAGSRAATVAAKAGRTSCLEEHPDACIFSPAGSGGGSIWLRAASLGGSPPTKLEVLVQVDKPAVARHRGDNQCLELNGRLEMDAPVLDIAEDCRFHSAARVRAFMLFLADRIQEVTLALKQDNLSRAPATATECFEYLLSLSLSGPGTRPRWMWSIDDATFPSHEEQQRYLLLQQKVPSMNLGRWFSGLLRFLAMTVQPLWSQKVLVMHTAAVPGSGSSAFFCSKRRRIITQPQLALRHGQVQQVLKQLMQVLAFVRSGLSRNADVEAPSVPSSAAERVRLASSGCSQRSAQVRAEKLLRELLDILTSLQEVLSLVDILHTSARLPSILAEPVLNEALVNSHSERLKVGIQPTALSYLLQNSTGQLVASQEGHLPFVKLCTALVIHIQEKSSAQGFISQSSSVICQRLQERCPGLFAAVDLTTCARPSFELPEGPSTSIPRALDSSGRGDIFRRYAQCVPVSGPSVDDHWALLIRNVRTAALEDAASAAEICVEKIGQLPQQDEASVSRVASLIEAFLDSLSSRAGLEPLTLARAVESMITRTSDWGSDEMKQGPSFTHRFVVDYLLKCQRLHPVLEVLISSSGSEMQAILETKAQTSRVASEFLAKYHHSHDDHETSQFLWLRLVESADHEIHLEDRIRYLRLAKELERSKGTNRSLKLSLRLDVAEKIQLPLFLELKRVNEDAQMPTRTKETAAKHIGGLQRLRELRELNEIAWEYSFFHIALAIATLSGAEVRPEIATTLWIGLFFPPPSCPYFALAGSKASDAPKDMFPLLFQRDNERFFSSDQALESSKRRGFPNGSLQLQHQVLGFVSELRMLQGNSGNSFSSSIWDARCVATVMEYCNCLWFRAVESVMPQAERFQGDGAAGMPVVNEQRAWVALEVMGGEPFKFTLLDMVAFYAEMLAHLDVWTKDLQAALPGTERKLTEEDVHLHLSEIAVTVLGRWIREAQLGNRDERFLLELRRAWLRTAEGLLASLTLRLNSLQRSHHVARRLLPEVLRLEKLGHALFEGKAG